MTWGPSEPLRRFLAGVASMILVVGLGASMGWAQPPPTEGAVRPEGAPIRYYLERVKVTGNRTTVSTVIRTFVPFDDGDVIDVEDPALEAVPYRLLGTGWFHDVQLRLTRGSRPGWVTLVVEVEERNTITVRELAFGAAEGVRRSDDTDPDLLPYVGLALAESNLLGLGKELYMSLALSARQQGLRLRYRDSAFLGSSTSLGVGLLYNNGSEFFGQDPMVSIVCPEPEEDDEEVDCPPEVLDARAAVVLYERFGLNLGVGNNLHARTRYSISWRGELVDVGIRPDAASDVAGRGGGSYRPIDFSVEGGKSVVSSVRFGIDHDHLNDPVFPSEGTRVRFEGLFASRIIASDYPFLRLLTRVDHYIPLPYYHHRLRLGAFAGVVFGSAPFFYQFHAADLSDLIPSRIHGMTMDQRSPPNLLGTSVEVMRHEEIATRLDLEYGIPLFRGWEAINAGYLYFGVGIYALADREDLKVARPGYEGLERIPMDVTFDLGFRADTAIGVFQLGFSNLLGFVEL